MPRGRRGSADAANLPDGDAWAPSAMDAGALDPAPGTYVVVRRPRSQFRDAKSALADAQRQHPGKTFGPCMPHIKYFCWKVKL